MKGLVKFGGLCEAIAYLGALRREQGFVFRMSCSVSRLVLLTLLLLAGSSLAFVGPTWVWYGGSGLDVEIQEYDVVLTQENPRFIKDFSHSIYAVEIIYLSTNDTAVTIEAVDSDSIEIARITGVCHVQNDTIVIEGMASTVWNLSVVRQDQNAEVSLTLGIWRILPAPVYMISPIPPYFIYGIILAMVAIYGFRIFDKSCGGTEKSALPPAGARWTKREGPILLIVLILISSAMFGPVIRGTAINDYRIVRNIENHANEPLIFTVDLASPTASVDLSSYLSNENDTFLMELESLEITYNPVSINITCGGTLNTLWLKNATVTGTVGVRIDLGMEGSRVLSIEQEDAAAAVAFTVHVEREYYASRVDPMPYLILAGFGFLPLCIAFWRVAWMSSKLRE